MNGRCPRCGAEFFYIRCPNHRCGNRQYDDNEEDDAVEFADSEKTDQNDNK